MNATYSVNLADYKAALRLHGRQSFLRRLNFFVWFIVPPIAATCGAVAFLIFSVNKRTHYAPLLFGLECAVVWIAIYLPLWRAYSVRKCVKQVFQDAGTQRTIELEATDECIRSVSPGVSEGKYFWKESINVVHDDYVVLLYVDKKRFIPIPKRSLSPSQLEELRATVARNAIRK